jgi:hypothetical protein
MLPELENAGVTAAFVDADQLRLASGVNASETELIAAALPALSNSYRQHGAQVLIVAGLADNGEHLGALLPGVPRERILAVHLDADADTIRDRIGRRGWLVDLADQSIDYAERIDPRLADLRLHTTGQTPDELAGRIAREALTHLRQSVFMDESGFPAPAEVVTGRMVAITGPGGVGVSTTGYQVFVDLARSGAAVGYVDAHQLGFLGTQARSGHLAWMRAANAHAVGSCLERAGSDTVVVSGDAPAIRALTDSCPSENVTAFWLHASPEALAERVAALARGDGPPVQGNHRHGLAGAALADAIAASVSESKQHEARPSVHRTIETTGVDPAQTAQTIRVVLAHA